MNTVILTSKKNFVWSSMQEIIPYLVRTWQKTASEGHDVFTFDIDEDSFAQYKHIFFSADNIVLTCFTPNLAKLASFLRNQLALDVRFFVNVHNQASIAFWPFRHWGDAQLFHQQDIFISSCSRDADCIRNTFPTAQIEVLPFSYDHVRAGVFQAPPLSSVVPFIFIGRLSSQKNLHSLVLSLAELKKHFDHHPWHFTFVGSADGLGSPNMGFHDTSYDTYLKSLVLSLGLEKQVTFTGQLNRSEVDQILERQKYIFVSPSLHSDENFGMAAFRALIQGHHAVLSDWGGHADFKKNFENQVELIPVKTGPCTPISSMTLGLQNALVNYKNESNFFVKPTYSTPEINGHCLRLLSKAWLPQGALATTIASDCLLERAQKSIQQGLQKIFESYDDPLAQPFFSTYGMKQSEPAFKPNRKLKLVPWAEDGTDQYIISDPHRGKCRISKNQNSKNRLSELGYLYED